LSLRDARSRGSRDGKRRKRACREDRRHSRETARDLLCACVVLRRGSLVWFLVVRGKVVKEGKAVHRGENAELAPRDGRRVRRPCCGAARRGRPRVIRSGARSAERAARRSAWPGGARLKEGKAANRGENAELAPRDGRRARRPCCGAARRGRPRVIRSGARSAERAARRSAWPGGARRVARVCVPGGASRFVRDG
jgi:hypothetical protein